MEYTEEKLKELRQKWNLTGPVFISDKALIEADKAMNAMDKIEARYIMGIDPYKEDGSGSSCGAIIHSDGTVEIHKPIVQKNGTR